MNKNLPVVLFVYGDFNQAEMFQNLSPLLNLYVISPRRKRLRYVPGQCLVLHLRVCFPSPTHGFPPYAGGGLVQDRVRYCEPEPQVLEHLHHLPQGLQPPFTAKKHNFNF